MWGVTPHLRCILYTVLIVRKASDATLLEQISDPSVFNSMDNRYNTWVNSLDESEH